MWNYKVSYKTKKINLGPKMLYFGLWARMLKIHRHICNQHPSICLVRKFPAKIRILQFWTSNPIFGCFRQQLLYLLSWCWNIEVWCKKWYIFKFGTNNIDIFEINNLEFFKLQNFLKKWKSPNLGPKVPDLGIFVLEFSKTIIIFEISTLKFVYFLNFAKN